MLTHPIIDKLQQMKFYGMLTAFEEQQQMADIEKFTFEDRLALLVDREMTERENKRLKTRLRKAKLKQNACVEDVDFRHPRGLDKNLFMKLAEGRYLKEHNNVLIIGSYRRWKNLPGVRSGSKCLPKGIYGSLFTPAAAVTRSEYRKGRWQIHQDASIHLPYRSPGSR